MSVASQAAYSSNAYQEVAHLACAAHAAEAGKVREEYDEYAKPIAAAKVRRAALRRTLVACVVFAVIGHALIQAESTELLEHLPVPSPYNQALVGSILLGAYWVTTMLAAAQVLRTEPSTDGDSPPWFKNVSNLPGAVYALMLCAVVALGVFSIGNGGLGIMLSVVGLGMACVAWIGGANQKRGITALDAQIIELEQGFNRHGKLKEIANRYWGYYRPSPETRRLVNKKLEHGLPTTCLAWFGKVVLAMIVSYPGHIAMGELAGFQANYSLGFKIYPVSWVIVGVLLLVAELLLIMGVVDLRFSQDASNYFVSGYNPGHYDRGYAYRDYDETRSKLFWAWLFIFFAVGLALVDFAFNVYYMWDQTGNAFLSFLGGGFFTGLLVGLAILLSNAYEYHHKQLKESKTAAEFAPNAPPLSWPPSSVVIPKPQPRAAETPASTPPPKQASLVGGPANRTFDLQTERSNTLGRGAEMSVCLDDGREWGVSREHAVIEWNGKAWMLQDLGSANGTYVDGMPLPQNTPMILRTGNVLRLGDYTLVFQEGH